MIQSELISHIDEIRTLLETPSNLSKKAIASCRYVAVDLADRCYFNAGWHMANPKKELSGTWSTKEIAKDAAVLLELLRSNQKPRRSKGRPEKPLDSGYMAAVVLVRASGAENSFARKKLIVESCVRAGVLKDRVRMINGERKTTSTEAHIKKIDRELKKLSERRATKTKNVLNSRPKKQVGRKMLLN